MSKKMVTPPKAWRKRAKKAFTRPSAWRKWKPFRQRGLGLGKLVVGALQAVTPTSDPMYKKLKYMENVDSLTNAGIRFATDDWQPLHEFEQWSKGINGKKFSEYTNKEMANILSGNDRDAIRALLLAKGIEDYNWEMTNLIQEKFPDLLAKHQKGVALKGKEIQSRYGEFPSMATPTGFGTGEGKTRDKYLDIHSMYGDSSKQILDQIVNEALNTIGD